MTLRKQIVICGAGIAGISAAYFLSKAGARDILLVDQRAPLTLTSDRSTECYRNWWPDPEIMALMNRSIDLLEHLAKESNNIFSLNRRGYLYVTADETNVPQLKARSTHISNLGGGPLRIHSMETSTYHPPSLDRYIGEPDGADLLLGIDLIQEHFPYITKNAIAALHVRRAGWLSAQQLGMYMLESGKGLGVNVMVDHVKSVDTSGGQIRAIHFDNHEKVECPIFVNAGGPYLKDIGIMLGINIPVQTELHLKVTFKDNFGVIARDAPLLIWDDPQLLPWQTSELSDLNADPETRWLTQPFPPGAHTRPEGSGESSSILMLWEYKTQQMDPVFPTPIDDQYPEVTLRGLSTMLPGLKGYIGHTGRPQVDGGYYVKTRENRLLVGPLPIHGAFVIGAMSGYGIMSACAAGELLAAHVLDDVLPAYASAFSLSRYEDPNYVKQLDSWGESGQL